MKKKKIHPLKENYEQIFGKGSLTESVDVASLVQKLSAGVGTKITPQNYEDWLHSGPTYDVFDDAVRLFIGIKAYDEMESSARLHDYLLHVLDLGPDNAGGVKFK